MPGLVLWLACADPSPAPPPVATTVPGTGSTGSIGGEPILSRPIVLGGIDTRAVEAGIGAQMDAIRRCYDTAHSTHPTLAGKVLVTFTIGRDGTVTNASTRSTSMWHPPTEECVTARVAEARFPPLATGETAIVSYPFVFPSR